MEVTYEGKSRKIEEFYGRHNGDLHMLSNKAGDSDAREYPRDGDIFVKVTKYKLAEVDERVCRDEIVRFPSISQ